MDRGKNNPLCLFPAISCLCHISCRSAHPLHSADCATFGGYVDLRCVQYLRQYQEPDVSLCCVSIVCCLAWRLRLGLLSEPATLRLPTRPRDSRGFPHPSAARISCVAVHQS